LPAEDITSWCPTGVEHIAISIAPSLKPLYDEYLRKERTKGRI
jgi:hypothetical protein